MNAVRVFEKEDGKKNSCCMKGEEKNKIRPNKKTRVILQTADKVKFIQSFKIRKYGHDKRVDKGRM